MDNSKLLEDFKDIIAPPIGLNVDSQNKYKVEITDAMNLVNDNKIRASSHLKDARNILYDAKVDSESKLEIDGYINELSRIIEDLEKSE